jgi:hypothetical protein
MEQLHTIKRGRFYRKRIRNNSPLVRSRPNRYLKSPIKKMDFETFKRNYDLDRSGRAFEKRGTAAPEYLTADGAVFDYGAGLLFL